MSDKELAWRILKEGGWVAYNPDMVAHHDHDPSILRALVRGARSVSYQNILENEYSDAPWRFLSENGRGLVSSDINFSWTEQVYEYALRSVRKLARYWFAEPHKDPLASNIKRLF